ncbi:MAG TPA: hypothetical protein VEP48_04900 [Methylomirabilota bacterium]|nr:hypothetical protein [Methylomirabilota bacterium]
MAFLLAWSGSGLAGCPDDDENGACESVAPVVTVPSVEGDPDVPFVDEITAPTDGIAFTFADPD